MFVSHHLHNLYLQLQHQFQSLPELAPKEVILRTKILLSMISPPQTFPIESGLGGSSPQNRIEEGGDFILNIGLSLDWEEEVTKKLDSQAPSEGTMESLVKGSQDYLLPECQLCDVVNSIPALLVLAIPSE